MIAEVAAAIFKIVEGTKTKAAVKNFRPVRFVTGKKFTVLVLRKAKRHKLHTFGHGNFKHFQHIVHGIFNTGAKGYAGLHEGFVIGVDSVGVIKFVEKGGQV
jgi:hypothetical protein